MAIHQCYYVECDGMDDMECEEKYIAYFAESEKDAKSYARGEKWVFTRKGESLCPYCASVRIKNRRQRK